MSQDLDQQVRQAVAGFFRQFPRRYPVFSILLGLAVLILLIWYIPQWQVPVSGLSLKDRLQQINENRKTVAQIVGGVFVLVGLYIAWVRSKATRDQAEVDRKQQLTDLYVKAIEQLGSEKLQIRLGGIYALERIARESPKDHWPIMEVLTAFVRENAPLREEAPGAKAKEEEESTVAPEDTKITTLAPQPPERPPTDIQAVLTVIGRRACTYEHDENQMINLRATYLAGADLLQTNLNGANLREANLQEAVFGKANLKGINFGGANLQGTNLFGANLQKALFREANLQGVVLFKANLHGADFLMAKLQGALLGEANLQGADLRWTNLQEARPVKANLRGATLEGANLKGAHLFKANLEEVYLNKADLRGADLQKAEGLTTEQVAEAIWDETTRWPEGFTPPSP